MECILYIDWHNDNNNHYIFINFFELFLNYIPSSCFEFSTLNKHILCNILIRFAS